jgi:flagellar biosynthesis protein FlhB
MADALDRNRTFEATARKVLVARSRGVVATSRDLSSGFVLLIACITLAAAGRPLLGGLVATTRGLLGHAVAGTSIPNAIDQGTRALASALALPALAIVLAACVVGIAQTRGLIRARPLRPDTSRIVPRLRRVWGGDKISLAIRDVGKAGLLLTMAALSLASNASSIAGLVGADVVRILDTVFALSEQLGFAMALALAGLGLADYLWQLHRHRKALRMTYAEVKREEKETEGDPAVKSARRWMHLEALAEHALVELVEADLLLVDPGRAAIALRYATELAEAPFVMFKGRNNLAVQAEAIARQALVPVVVDAGLVGRLTSTPEGEEIPEVLYEPVAQLLADAHPRRSWRASPGRPMPTQIGQRALECR